MSSLPPFLAPPPDDWRGRVRGFLVGTGRQRRPLAILVVVALAVGYLTWRELRPQPEPAPADGGPITLADVETATPEPTPGPEPTPVFVHVTGRVRSPGIQELSPGSRVADAVESAGGTTEGADLQRVNLARRLTDGEQIHVPAVGEPIVTEPARSPDTQTEPTPTNPIDLNTATQAQLTTLPGVGEVTATRIIEHRTRTPFRQVEDLLEVPGIGESKLEDLRDLVTVS